MKERLIKLLKEVKYPAFKNGDFNYCFGTQHPEHVFEIVAEHLIENGVIVPPCKLGDTVYQIIKSMSFGEVGDTATTNYRIEERKFSMGFLDEFGKTVFLTHEAAEAKLKEMEGAEE